MGRRRRKVIRVQKRKLPTIYLCPKCGKETIRIKLLKDQGIATIQCGNCGLSDKFDLNPSLQEIDIYCQFTDNFY